MIADPLARSHRPCLAIGLLIVLCAITFGPARAIAQGELAGPGEPVAADLPHPAAEFPAAEGSSIPSPLAPPATATPRETLESLRRYGQAASSDLMRAFRLSQEDGSLWDTDEIRQLKANALANLGKAAGTLDLAHVPPATRRSVGITSVLLLEEIFDRIQLPLLDAIPNEPATGGGQIPGYTIPGTEIRITAFEKPDGTIAYLFSGDTVRRLQEFYERVRHLPSSDRYGVDFYKHFAAAPGLSMPMTIYGNILRLPPWAIELHHDQATWQWIAFGVWTLLMGGFVYAAARWDARRPVPIGPLNRASKRLLLPIVLLAALYVFKIVADEGINLTGAFLGDVELVVETMMSVVAAWLAVLVSNMVAEIILGSPRIARESLDASLIKLILRLVGLFVAGYILFVGMTRIGIPIYGIVAGLGVGGLAIALAVRPTLENFIGGIILYADRPVKVGDFCKFGDTVGTVESIGLRSTRIRAVDRTIITVQNSEFAQMRLVNFTRRDQILFLHTIGLTYETTPAQLDRIIEAIGDMLRADDRTDTGTVRVRFLKLADYSLDVEVRGYVRTGDWATYLGIQQEFLFRIMDIVRENGASFAFPTQTNHLVAERPSSAAEPVSVLRLAAAGEGGATNQPVLSPPA